MNKFIKSIFLIILAICAVIAQSTFAAREDEVWHERLGSYLETIWPEGRDILINGQDRYLNFYLDSGFSGYGFRDNGGVMEFKNEGGSWTGIGSGGGGGGVGTLLQVTTLGATTNIESTFSGGLITTQVKASTSAGLIIDANNGVDVGLLGVGNTANVTWYGAHTFAGNLTVNTNALFVEVATDRVGLGLTTPSHQLHVRGAGQATANITDAGATGGSIFVQDTGASNSNGGAVIFGSNNQRWAAIKGIYTSGANNGLGDLVISTRRLSTDTAFTEAIRVTSGGNLTILSPVAVSANSQFSIRTNTDRNFAWTGFNGAPEMFSINDAFNAYTELRVNGSPLRLNNASAGNIEMVVGGGNVGIGVASPTYRLTVGSGSTVGTAAAPALSIGNLATGIYLAGGQLAFTQAGLLKAYFDLSNRFVVNTAELQIATGIIRVLGSGSSIFTGGIVSGGSFTGGSGGAATAAIVVGQRWQLASSGTAGDLTIYNNSGTSPVKIQFGGTTASFPSIENIGANLIIRSANATNATRVAIGGSSPSGMLHVTAIDDATIAGIFQAASLSAVNTVEFRDSAGSTMSNIDKDGRYIFGSPSAILLSTFGSTNSIISSSPSSWNVNQMSIESKGASSVSAGAFLGLYSNDGAAMASGDRLGGFFVGGFDGTNIRNATMIHGFATETWTSTAAGADIVFATTLNGTNARADKFWMKHNGNMGIGTSSPNSRLDVWGNLNVSTSSIPTLFADTSTTRVGIASSTPGFTLGLNGTVGFTGLTTSGTGNGVCISTRGELLNAGGASCTPSSKKFKENVKTLKKGFALDTLSRLRLVSFDYKEKQDFETNHSYGVIAEEVAKVDPSLVDYDVNGEVYGVHFEKITGLLVQAVNELAKAKGVAQRTVEENYQWYAIAGLLALILGQQFWFSYKIKKLTK